MTDQTKKQNAGKAPVFQGVIAYFPRALKKVAEVSEFGRSKYGASWDTKGWQDVPVGDLQDALARHLCDRIIDGEINRADGECLHLAQQAWEALASLEVYLQSQETNARNAEKFTGVAAELFGRHFTGKEADQCN